MQHTLESAFNVQPVTQSRLSEIDMNNIPFGRVFSDHMLVAEYSDGKWQQAEIKAFGKIGMAPSLMALNYGQSVFEGMKAFRGDDGQVRLFRPTDNWRRINQSAYRICMPEIPESLFMDGLKELIQLDSDWIPQREQGSLYIRPLYFASDQYIGVRASESYLFTVFTCPVGPYYTKPVSLLASKEFIRAAGGGTGSAKVAGNYASAMLPDRLARERGYQNVLWLDARHNEYVEECGTMNVFFVIGDTVITPNLTGTILPGITRNSALRLLKDNGYKVETRPISIYEVQEAYKEGELKEAFGAGTAATISHIEKIGFNGADMMLPAVEDRKVGPWLYQAMEDIKYGVSDDPYGWVVKV